MSIQLSLAHATLLDVRPPDLVHIASMTGYAFVGLRLIPMGRPGEPRHGLDEHPHYLRETKRALSDTGVRFLDIEVVQIRDDLDPRSYLPALEATAELGGTYVLTNVYSADRGVVEERFGRLCDLARPLGLTVALEFVSFSDVSTLAQAHDLVRSSGRDNAVVLIDTLHLHSSCGVPSDLDLVASARPTFVHLCDGPGSVPANPADLRRIAREERLLPGEGGIDLAPVLRRLPQDVVYAVEAQNPGRSAALGAAEYARLAHDVSMRYLRTVLGRD